MRRIYLSARLLLLSLLASFSVTYAQEVNDTSYTRRTLTFEEANFVSSYYHQDGDHAAVTGGLGSETLTDIANVFDVKFYSYSAKGIRHTLGLEAGIDHYTSASSDMVDLRANSSASSHDTRFYPSLTWTAENEKKGWSLGGALSFSTEFDYKSLGAGLIFSKKSKDRNREFSGRLQAYLDQVLLIYPVELRPGGSTGHHYEDDDYGSSARNSYSGSFSLSQVLTPRLQIMLDADVISQNGFLSLPFHRVYFTDMSVHSELMPDKRLKVPFGARLSYFAGDRFIFRAFYRYYSDDWGIHGNTASLEIPVKISPFLSISPFYRYYDQSAAKYFAPYALHSPGETFYTSNYDLSRFSSHFAGAGIRWMPLHGIFGSQHFSSIEARYGNYSRSDGLHSMIVSLHLQFR